MAQIYDNINQQFVDGLRGIIGNIGVTRAGFCVGYFNLRGWSCISDLIDKLPGDFVYETEKDDEEQYRRYCRLLIGMQKTDEELIQSLYSVSGKTQIDSEAVQRAKRRIVEDFRKQLVICVPTKQDEKTLRDLVQQLRLGKVVVKLYLKN